MALISVIVPTKRRNHLLPRALESLFAQTLRDFEVVIVDDNPPEGRVTHDPTLSALIRHKQVRVLENARPKNAAAARNHGLRYARGEWISYLDDDDAYRPLKLQKQLEYAERSGLCLGVCGLTYRLHGRRRTRVNARNELRGADLLLHSLAMPTLFHRRADDLKFDEAYCAGEDLYFFHRLIRHFNTDRIFNVPESLVDVYPQEGDRVNRNAEAIWQASLAVHRDFASIYGKREADIFLARAELGRCRFREDAWGETFRVCRRLASLRGWKDWRVIVNTVLYKCPVTRRFVVS
jgi:glycosyltransferase involved in cell wall biosynthesis